MLLRGATPCYSLLGTGTIQTPRARASTHARLRNRLTPRIVLPQVCRAVDYLHRHTPPIAHRDLKLENVLVGKHHTIKLCDFGSCVTHTTRCEDKASDAALSRASPQLVRGASLLPSTSTRRALSQHF